MSTGLSAAQRKARRRTRWNKTEIKQNCRRSGIRFNRPSTVLFYFSFRMCDRLKPFQALQCFCFGFISRCVTGLTRASGKRCHRIVMSLLQTRQVFVSSTTLCRFSSCLHHFDENYFKSNAIFVFVVHRRKRKSQNRVKRVKSQLPGYVWKSLGCVWGAR